MSKMTKPRRYYQSNQYRVEYKTESGALERTLIRAHTARDARTEARNQGIRRIQSLTYVPSVKFSSTPEFDEWADPVVPRMEF